MNFKLNDNFISVKKDNKLSVTSVLPDMNMVFNFDGVSATILEDWFSAGTISTDRSHWENKLQQKIPQADWDSFIKFLTDKEILIQKP